MDSITQSELNPSFHSMHLRNDGRNLILSRFIKVSLPSMDFSPRYVEEEQ